MGDSQRGRSPSKKERSGDGKGSPERQRHRSKSPSKERGRSTSPSKFAEGDFERKKLSGDSAKRRQNALAKVKGLKLDPSQWSRQELIDKLNGFAHFTVDNKTGVATLSSENKRLLSEDISVLQEIMRRVTEIQEVNLSGCGLTDAVFSELLDKGLTGLRHLKILRLQSNLLSGPSVDGIVRAFSRSVRKIQVLDLQFNSLSFKDGHALFTAFGSSVQELNGLNMGQMMGADKAAEVLTLSNKALRVGELGIVCGMLAQRRRIHTVDLSHNRISAEGLVLMVAALKDMPHVRNLDLSGNPLTNEGTELAGVQALLALAKHSTQLLRVGFEGVLVPGSAEEQSLTHSLMANRAVERHNDGYYFSKFAQSLIERTAKRDATKGGLAQWQGKLQELDLAFIRLNSVPQVSVQVQLADQSGTGRDEIRLVREALPTKGLIEF
jgi:hypothetical protein